MPPTVIVTGASKSMGLAAARFLLEDGARVVTVQRSSTPELLALGTKYPKTLRIVQGDFTELAIVSKAINEAQTAFGSIDAVVFNAAANSAVGPVDVVPVEAWQKLFDINVFGVVRFLRELLPVLKDGARIIFISSGAAEGGFMTLGPYAASKAALNSINRTVAAEHPGKVCIALHPGPTKSDMTSSYRGQAKDYLPPSIMQQMHEGLMEPEIPGRVIANLALRAGPELSGQYLHWNNPVLQGL